MSPCLANPTPSPIPRLRQAGPGNAKRHNPPQTPVPTAPREFRSPIPLHKRWTSWPCHKAIRNIRESSLKQPVLPRRTVHPITLVAYHPPAQQKAASLRVPGKCSRRPPPETARGQPPPERNPPVPGVFRLTHKPQNLQEGLQSRHRHRHRQIPHWRSRRHLPDMTFPAPLTRQQLPQDNQALHRQTVRRSPPFPEPPPGTSLWQAIRTGSRTGREVKALVSA